MSNNVDTLADRLDGADISQPSVVAKDQPPASASPEPATEENKETTKPQEETNLVPSSYDVQVTLADQQADPDSPLYSVKSFDQLGLHPDLLQGIYGMKFTKPSKIQERALPLLLQNPARNMIGQSQSGTGKTAAFVLDMLSRIDYTLDKPQALALAPSRELARQTMDVVQEMGKYTPVQTLLAVPDAPGAKRSQKTNAHLVVGTPGKVQELIKYKALDPSNIKVFVLDEADNMLDQQGLGDQSIRTKNAMPKGCQLVLFSATFPDHVREFAGKIAPGANEIRLKQEELNVSAIKQFFMDADSEEDKFRVLLDVYQLLTIGQSIIFVGQRSTADRIAQRLTAEGHQVASLHGALDARERDAKIDAFRQGKSKVLIATNVIARGIDISQVNMVVNYELPRTQDGKPDVETYLHRIGRTGRFGRQGVSINMVDSEQAWKDMNTIEKALKTTITPVPTDDPVVMEETLKKAMKV